MKQFIGRSTRLPAKMDTETALYRELQKHLDRQPVGFPSTRSGADIRLLKRVFTPEEARVALVLSYEPLSTQVVTELTASWCNADHTKQLLDSMLSRGAIARRVREHQEQWHLAPLVVGIYEFQDGKPSKGFLKDASDYMKTLSFKKSLLAVKPSQMRTIPVNRSISVTHEVASYNRVREIVMSAQAPFVVIDCICRTNAKLRRKPCTKTSRRETCLGFGDMAAMALHRTHGREISREEALAILELNEEEGLVLQPSNAKHPQFICSCCGCCCGMLGMQKQLPYPKDFWTSSFYAEVSNGDCIRCGTCLERCQVMAVEMPEAGDCPKINVDRCIGCGLCVSTCPTGILTLKEKSPAPFVPEDDEQLFREIGANRKSRLGEWLMIVKLALRLRQ